MKNNTSKKKKLYDFDEIEDYEDERIQKSEKSKKEISLLSTQKLNFSPDKTDKILTE